MITDSQTIEPKIRLYRLACHEPMPQFGLIFSTYWVILIVRFGMIGYNLEQIRKRIITRCDLAGRKPSEVTLLAVTKTFPAEHIAEAVRLGVTDIGENYVQELLTKRAALKDDRIRWHFIGHLQSNKVRHIIDWVHLIHAVDTTGLAVEIDQRAKRAMRVVDVLLEINTTGEQSKFGLAPERTIEFVRKLEELESPLWVEELHSGMYFLQQTKLVRK